MCRPRYKKAEEGRVSSQQLTREEMVDDNMDEAVYAWIQEIHKNSTRATDGSVTHPRRPKGDADVCDVFACVIRSL